MRRLEIKPYFPIAGFFCARDVAPIQLEAGVPVLDQRLEREDHIFRCHRRAVMKARLRPERVLNPRVVCGHLHGLADQTILGERLIAAAHDKRFVEVHRGGVRHVLDDPRIRRVALKRKGIEAVERPYGPPSDRAALGRIRIQVVHVLEVCRIFRLAIERKPMHRLSANDRLGG